MGGTSPEALGGKDWPRPLIVLCALLAGKPDMAKAAATPMTDAEWDGFTDLAIDRHRVAPAIAEAARASSVALPGPVLQTIRAEARANGFAALAQKSESLRLAGMLEAVGVRAIWLKGWSLAEQLYGAPGLRHSNDIDFLVAPGERIAAARCLAGSGFVPAGEHRLRGRLFALPAVEAECKDMQYIHPESGLVVELHWRTSHFRSWPEFRDLDEAPVALPGVAGPASILVPGPLGQLVYLSGHGQQHLFGRLKWLLDIARLADLRGPARLADDLGEAETAGAGRAVRLALHLAHRVFAANVPGAARDLPRSEARWAGEFLAEIADPGAAPGRPRARLGFYRWHLRMAETPAQFAGVLRYALWRRLRLGLAGLTHSARDGDA
ncbi:MAG: nucleotidyltransferase family protein [Paracoccaceae bacterium]